MRSHRLLCNTGFSCRVRNLLAVGPRVACRKGQLERNADDQTSTLDEVLKHSSSRANLRLVRGDGDTVFPGLAFFARRATRGSFYVVQDPQLEGKAAKTEDELLAAAIDAGFTRFVVPEAMAEFAAPAEATVISADDPMAGAIAMVRSVEDHARGKIVTVAGSVGKTTVKEMTRQAIEYIHPLAEVEPSALNPNMFRPVLRNISRAGRYDFSVIEVSAAAILRGLEHDFLVSSDVTIITSISEAHLDAFGTVERAAKTKARILDRPRTPESVAVVYGDSRFSDDLAERARDMGWSRTISYGSAAGNDVQLVGAEVSTGAVSARVYGEPIDFRMESVRGGGKHWAVNAMASIAALVALGEDWQKAIPALESFSPPAGRGNKWRVPAPVGGEPQS